MKIYTFLSLLEALWFAQKIYEGSFESLQGWILIIFLFTYLVDGFLFFYYKKNDHLNAEFKAKWIQGIRIFLMATIELLTGDFS